MTRPGAATITELVLVLSLFALVLAALGRFVGGHARLAATQADEVRLMELTRTARLVLGADLRPITPADLAARAPDSVRLRVFRGSGPVCAGAGDAIWIRYRGARLPDPAKDSVLIVSSAGEEEARATIAWIGSGCEGEGHGLQLDRAPAHRPLLALVFETGAYHLADGALRYRRGRGGRQPLVEALLAESSFEWGPRALRLELTARADSLPRLGEVRRQALAPVLNRMAP